ncbi:MAG TPA: acyltransferase [Kineosporiaceae bacterium]|nr:acyltransferase [Kineosporiaceae bacterium]
MTAIEAKASAPPVDPADTGASTTLENEHSGRPRHDLPELEAFRGLAAVMVLFTHVGFDSGAGVLSAWAGWLSRLDFGVTLFFLLSGFLLFRPYVQHAYGRRPAVSARSYLRRRYVRIYPALIVVLIFDYFISPGAREASISEWLYTLLMIQNYTMDFLNHIPGMVQGWSLCVEVSFYLLLPLIAPVVLGTGTAAAHASARARAAREQRQARTPAEIRQAALELSRRRLPYRILGSRDWRAELPAMRPGLLLAGMVLIAIAWRLIFLVYAGGQNRQNLWLPGFFDWFAAGMALAWLRERDREVPKPIRDIASSTGACWSLALAGYWLTTTKLAGPFGLEAAATMSEALLKHFGYLVIATLIMLPVVLGDPAASWRRVACTPFFAWLGQISFGIFLWHPMLMAAIRRMLRLAPLTGGGFWVTLILTLIASSVAATLSWRLIEQPLQRRWRNGFRHRRPTDAPPFRWPVLRRKATSTS